MSDDPNDRAARLAGRWGSEDDADGGADRESAPESAAVESAAVESAAVESGESAGAGDPGSGNGGGSVGGEDGSSDGDDDRELTTREMQSQMLYLPPEFHKELDLTFQELDLRFRRERDRKLQKNKDFYAGLLRLGMERLGEVRDRELDEVEELLDL